MANKKKVGILLSERDLRRRYPDSAIASTIVLPEDQTLRLPSDILAINYHLGGGVKYGTIIELGGEESTGKSLLLYNLIKVAQSMGGWALLDDAECTFDGRWAEKHGVNLSKMDLLPYENEIELVSDWIADMCIYRRSKLVNNEPIILAIDSLAVLEGGDALETAEMDTKAEMGRRSFKMGSLLRKRMKIFAKYGICVVLINQIRKKVGASKFEDPETTPMAQVMKYYASQRVFLYRGKKLKTAEGRKGKWVGNVVYVRTKKNKSSTPRDSVQAELYFEEHNGKFGYSKYFGFPEILVDKGIVKRKQAVFYYKGERLCKGDGAFLKLITEDDKLRRRLIRRLGTTTPSMLREKLESIKKNLYPVRLKKVRDEQEETDQEE